MTAEGMPFKMERLGVVAQPLPDHPYEVWGILNPGGVRGPAGDYHLFPRLVAEGNYSRIGHARVTFDAAGNPAGIERLGYALQPGEPYERARMGGGVEDARVTYVEPLRLYVMTYTAYVPHRPRIALAVSRDLADWHRLGPVRFSTGEGEYDLNASGNKDGIFFPGVVRDPRGRPSLALLHRPTYALHHGYEGAVVVPPPGGAEHRENIWISYVPLEHAHADLHSLTRVHEHRIVMEPQAGWEQLKLGGGTPPIRLSYGWLLLYHGVSPTPDQGDAPGHEKHVRYCAGAAVLDPDDPSTVLYRSPRPILEPEASYEVEGIVAGVVFPTATDRRDGDRLDVYYGAADSVTAAARLAIPDELPVVSSQ